MSEQPRQLASPALDDYLDYPLVRGGDIVAFAWKRDTELAAMTYVFPMTSLRVH